MTSKQTCEPSVIPQFLNEELEGDQLQTFTQHLADCTACQQAIEAAAAEDRFWRETVEQLAPTSSAQHFAGGPQQVTFNVSSPPSSDTGLSSADLASCEEKFSTTDQQVKALLQSLSPTDDPTMLGRIGDYEVSGVVGIGGMGAVLKGFDRSLMRVVAIKVMAPHLANKGSARKRFEREARAAAAISHDNVVNIYRVDELNGLPYLVMPFARGPSLQTRIDRDGPLSAIETVLVGKQIASGLAAAHEQGLVHRDIKPANILLNDGTERVLITDFGVARAMDDASMTQTGLIAGTPQFMSPEQARGEVVDQRSDLFSLGSLLYTICTGRPPFRAEAPFGVLRKITDAKPKSIVDVNPEIPSWLISVIDRLMEKDPTKRLNDAQEVADLLEKCLAHLRQPNLIELPDTVIKLQAQPSPPVKVVRRNSGGGTRAKLAWAAGGLVAIFFAIWGTLALTAAPDIAGDWQGEQWTDIQLNSVQEAQDWYTGSFTDGSGNQGAIHLEWSRLGQRFQGRWSTSQEKSGAIVLRPADARSVRGAISFDSDAVAGKDELRLRDFVWQEGKSEQPKRAVNSTKSTNKETPVASRLGDPSALQKPILDLVANQNADLSSAVEILSRMADLDAKIAAGKDRLAAEQAATSGFRKSVKDGTDTIEADQVKLKSISGSGAAIERIRLQRTIAAQRNQLRAAQTSLQQSQEKVASLETELDELTRQRQAMIELVLLDHSALKKQRDRLAKLVRFEQMQFEQGDLTELQRDATKSKLEAVETKFKQLDYLLNHFNEQAAQKAKPKEPSERPSLADEVRLTADAIARDPGELGVRGALNRLPAKTEEPATDQPATDQPTTEEPTTEEPTTEEPTTEEPTTEEPATAPLPKTTNASESAETKKIDAIIDTIATKQMNVGLAYRELSTALSATRAKRIEAEVRVKGKKDQLNSLSDKKNILIENLDKLRELIKEASSAGFVERNGKKINFQELEEMAQSLTSQIESVNAQLEQTRHVADAWQNRAASRRSQESDLTRQLHDVDDLLAQFQSRAASLKSLRSAVFDANAETVRTQKLNLLIDKTKQWLGELDAKIEIELPSKETLIEKK